MQFGCFVGSKHSDTHARVETCIQARQSLYVCGEREKGKEKGIVPWLEWDAGCAGTPAARFQPGAER